MPVPAPSTLASSQQMSGASRNNVDAQGGAGSRGDGISASVSVGDLSLSQSISASASDLKRPSSSASSIDESQTLSRTKSAKAHYGKAARAFLQKNHMTALVESQQAADILSSSSHLSSSLTSSAILSDGELELTKLVEKVVILRLTALTHVYTNSGVKEDVFTKLNSSTEGGVDSIKILLSKQPEPLMSHLWFEALRLCSQIVNEMDAPSLEPTPETLLLAVELPASVIAATVLAALRLDALFPSSREGTKCARLIAEWYLAAFSSAFHAQPPTEKASSAYEKIVGLYSVHVLATRLDEWEYAREFVGYSSLQEAKKFELLGQINDAQAYLAGKQEREIETTKAAQKLYDEEKAKRDAEARIAAGNKSGGGIAKDFGNFLRGPKSDEKSSSGKEGSSKKQGSSPSNKMTADTSSSGSDSGSAVAPRSESSAYFSPRASGSTSSSSTSPALSPGSTRSTGPKLDDSELAPKMDRKRHSGSSTGRRSSSKSSVDRDGNESSTSAASTSSRSKKNKDRSMNEKDDTTYAATRAHLSRYIEKDHTTSRSTSNSRAVDQTSSSFLSILKSWFDFRNAQPRTYLMSAIVMILIFRRVVRRPPTGQRGRVEALGGKGPRSAAARNARSKLVARNQGGDGILGLGWLLLIWRKVVDTIRMGTQVTYL